MQRKKFKLSFSLQREGANLQKVKAINLHWYFTPAALNLLPGLKALLKSFPSSKGKDFSATAMELEMKSAAYLKLNDEAWLTVAKADARQGIYDIGVELTPKKGLPFVEGGSTLISALSSAGWKPVTFETIEKKSTEQRKVVEKKEALKKIIFKLSFQRQISQEAIKIPPEVQVLASGKIITWGYSHVWYNPVIMRSININFTKALFFKRWLPPEWEIIL